MCYMIDTDIDFSHTIHALTVTSTIVKLFQCIDYYSHMSAQST